MNRTEDVFLSHEHLWSYRTRTVDPNSLTIRSVTHNGILQHVRLKHFAKKQHVFLQRNLWN